MAVKVDGRCYKMANCNACLSEKEDIQLPKAALDADATKAIIALCFPVK